MGDFTKYSNYNENTSHSSVVFGSNSPLLEVELNELQQIADSKLSRLVKIFGSGVVAHSSNSVSFNSSTLTLTLTDCSVITANGVIAYVPSASIVLSTSSSAAYFEVKEVVVDSNTEMREYGNTNGQVVTNTIKDSRFSVETSKRKAITYTLKTSGYTPNDTDTIKYVSVGTYSSSSGFTFKPWGIKNPVFSGSVSLGRKTGTTVGDGSAVFGGENTATSRSYAFGYKNNVTGANASAFGLSNTVSGSSANAFGEECKASGIRSFATGYRCTASGSYSFAEGNNTTANNDYAHSMGNFTTALKNQLVMGAYNDITVAKINATEGATTGSAFVIGNGVADAKSNAFRVQGDGVTYAKGAYNATGADYAEYFEWADGNPTKEDRRGYFVTLDDTDPSKIRKATTTDVYVLGVVSGNPCVVGNSDESWVGKYLFDDFGAYIYETVEKTIEVLDEETGEVTQETIEVTQYKLNPNYDDTLEYIPRSERPEWSAVGLIGTLAIVDDGTCQVGGYCTWNEDGVATATDPGKDNYRVIERVSDNIIKAIIK